MAPEASAGGLAEQARRPATEGVGSSPISSKKTEKQNPPKQKIPIKTKIKNRLTERAPTRREEEVPGWHCIVNRLFDCYKVSDSSIFLLLPGLQMPDLVLQTGSRQHR